MGEVCPKCLAPGAQGPGIQELGTPGDAEAEAQRTGLHTRGWDRPTEHHARGGTTVFILHLRKGLWQPGCSLCRAQSLRVKRLHDICHVGHSDTSISSARAILRDYLEEVASEYCQRLSRKFSGVGGCSH